MRQAARWSKAAEALTLSALLTPVGTALAAQPKVAFDQGTDARAVVDSIHDDGTAVPMVAESVGPEHATRSCATIQSRYGDPSATPPAALESHVYQTECTTLYGREQCTDKLKRIEKRSVTISFQGPRTIYPWEIDVFSACLENTAVSLEVLKASNKYRFNPKPGPQNFVIEAQAAGKIQTDPDPAGIAAESFGQKAGAGLVLSLKDKWAQYYKGEKTWVQVTLKRDVPHWLDAKIFKAEIVAPASDAYEIRFETLSPELKAKLTPGEKYYAEWSFAREGKVSTDATQSGGQTPRIEYAAAP